MEITRVGTWRAGSDEERQVSDTTDVVVADRSQRRPVSRAKGAAEIWMRSGFEQASVGLAILDDDGRHTLVNPAYIQQTGRSKSSLIGAGVMKVLTPDSQQLLRVWREERHRPTTIEVVIDRPGQPPYEASMFLTPIDARDARGHTLVQVIGSDVSPTARDSAARLRAIVDHVSDLVLMTRADGALTYVSPSVERATGCQTSQLLGSPFSELVHPDDRQALVEAARTGRSSTVEVDVRLTTPAGWTIHHCRISEVRDQLGSLLGLAYLARSVTNVVDPESPQIETEHADPGTAGVGSSPAPIAETTSRHETSAGSQSSAIVSDTSDLIWQFDQEGPVYANPAARAMRGLTSDSRIDDLGLGDIHPDWAVERIARHGVPQTLAGVVWEEDLAVLDSSGNEVPVSFVLAGHRDGGGPVTHWSSISRPIDRSLRNEAAIRRSLTHDPLTALPGRVLLFDRIEVALARATRTGQRVGMLLLDLDFFESVNTSVGIDIADRLLVAIAERLRTSIRPGDTIGRIGDDEFVVLCEHFDQLDDAERFAERLLRDVEEPIELDGADWFVSMSVGIALARQGVTTPDGLLRNASSAMYRAKELGRGRHVVFGNMISTPELPLDHTPQGAETLAPQGPEHLA